MSAFHVSAPQTPSTPQPALGLELADRVLGLDAERVGLVGSHGEPRAGEAVPQLGDGAPSGAGAEHGPFAQAMNSERSWSS